MARKDYMPVTDAGKADLFTHVATTLPTHFAVLGISAITPQVVAQAADAVAFAYVCSSQQTLVAASQQATNAKNRLRDGDPIEPGVSVDLAFPSAPGTVPSPVLPGVVARFRIFVKWLKGLAAYTDAIGEALQIVGDEETGADFSTVKPVLPLKISGGQVVIGWGWGGVKGLESCEIEVDRGNGQWVMLTIDARPGYVDTEPFPTPAAKWKYRAIYRRDDGRVGQWSDVAEIMVGA